MGECLRYCVLLVITDGMTETIGETKRKLGVYSSVPLSVIFVGVGRADFTAMHYICDSEPGIRKNSTFVSFRQHQHNPAALGRAALQHIPNQLVQYMLQQGIQPSKNSR
jgi:Copine